MGGYISFAGAGGANQNLDNTYERIGQGAVGAGVSVVAGSGSKGSYATIGDVGSTAWAGFWVYVWAASTSSTRYLIDLSTGANGSEVVFVPNLYIEPNVAVPIIAIFLPLNVAASAHIRCRAQGSGAGNLNIWLKGVLSNSQSAPMFNTMTALAVDTTNTRAFTSDITMVASGSTTFTTIKDPTAATYGAILTVVGVSSVGAVTTTQPTLLNVATGAAASETIIDGLASGATSGSAASFRTEPSSLIYKSVASGARISVQMLAGTVGANDKYTCGIYGFS